MSCLFFCCIGNSSNFLYDKRLSYTMLRYGRMRTRTALLRMLRHGRMRTCTALLRMLRHGRMRTCTVWKDSFGKRCHLSNNSPMKNAACATPLVSCSIQFALESALSRMIANTDIRTIPRRPATKKITDGKDVTAWQIL